MIQLNKEYSEYKDNIEIMIAELFEREEYSCTGNVCAADACGAHQIEI